jgi:hypothetical protein
MWPKTEVVLLRNAIDLDRWHPTENEDEPDTVGWVGAIPWRSGDLETMRGVLPDWVRRNDWRFYHGGHTPSLSEMNAGQVIGVSDDDIDWAPFQPISHYPELFQPLHVGIVPLNDNTFNQAKSCIKGLEYAASGVPFIAQELAEYSEYSWLRTQGIGRTARRAVDWRRELNRMLDAGFRADQRAANLEAVRLHDVALRADEWAAAYAHFALCTV